MTQFNRERGGGNCLSLTGIAYWCGGDLIELDGLGVYECPLWVTNEHLSSRINTYEELEVKIYSSITLKKVFFEGIHRSAAQGRGFFGRR
jgi:hypothetical protein